MTQHIGIFLCTCDGKIEQTVQVDAFPYVMRANQNVALVKSMPHVCLPDGVRALQNAVHENHLDRVVIAACPARFQEKNLRDVCTKAGINSNHFTLVDWREGCVDAHHASKEDITGKAIDLVQMGVARVSNAYAIKTFTAEINPSVLVIGGGIAGMTAARTLADRGIKVTLVEREASLGGQLRNASLNGSSGEFHATLDAVQSHNNIQMFLNSRIIAADGSVGNYHVKIGRPKSTSTAEFSVGAIVVATGAQEYRDALLYRYDGHRVLTLGEFQSQFPISNAQFPNSMVYILCAGSRDERISYCSNVCCINALNQAIRVKGASPETKITILFRDLYLLGDELNEEIVREARRAGIEFARYAPARPPRVSKDSVEVCDEITNTTRRIEYDRLVLATPLAPRDDAGVLARLLKLARDQDGFFLDLHQRVRPDEQAERGIFVCGSAHRPVDIDTAILQGMTAAARATRLVQRGEIKRTGLCAGVDSQICTGCAQCVETCAFGAIEMTCHSSLTGMESTGRAVIDPFLCLACGNCVVACPSKAIDLPSACDAQIFAQIQCALAARRHGTVPILVFACRWSGHAAMELAGARGMTYPANVRVVELPCSARLDPLHVLCAFNHGADQVMLALCPSNECHFGNGDNYARARIENLREQLAAHGIDPQRLQIAPMMGDDAEAWVKAIDELNTKNYFNLGYQLDAIEAHERRHA